MVRSSKHLILIPALFLLLSGCQTTGMAEDGDREGVVTFSVVGDIMVHDSQLSTAYKKECECYDYHPVFSEVKPYIADADVAIANLETTMPGDPAQYSGYPQFGAPDSLVTAVKDTGFDVLTTANNHSMDKGKATLIRTIDVIEENRLSHLGTYRSRREWGEHRVLIKETNGLKLAYLDYTYGTNGIPVPPDVHVNLIDKEQIREDMELAKMNHPDGIIVLYHFGTEYLHYPDEFQKEYVDYAFDLGADMVLGGHPHVLQPFKVIQKKDSDGVIKNRLVIYSLGNFVSNQRKRYRDGGIIFRFTIHKNENGPGLVFGNVHYIPVWVHAVYTGPDRGHYILPVENYIDEKSSPGKLDSEARRQMMVFYHDTKEHLRASMDALALQNPGE